MECKGTLACRAVKRLLPSLFLLLALASAVTVPVEAQTATTATFSITGVPMAGILQAGDGNFYSISVPIGIACKSDATKLCSYIYQITPAGNTSVFYSFQPVLAAGNLTNADGFLPVALIAGTDGNLYGACLNGGPGGGGTIFKLAGGVLTVIKSFGISDPGASPNSLIEGADGNFYFTNTNGVYQLTPAGVMNTIFTFTFDATKNLIPNGDNATSLMQGSDNNFYVTVDHAPGSVAAPGEDVGAIVQISPGGQWNLVHSFAPDASEGKIRGGPLAQGKDGTLFGVTKSLSGVVGTVFQVSPGGAFKSIHTFPGNIVGSWNSALFLGSDGNFYGVTLQGGDTTSANCTILPTPGCGTVYQVTPSGTFSILHNFEGGRATSFVVADNPQVDGGGPTSPLVQGPGGIFYGTADGTGGTQTAFSLTMNPAVPSPVQLTVSPATAAANSNVTLKWKVLNAYSTTAQQCGASVVGNPPGAGAWSGRQTGSLVNGVYSGSATIKPILAGDYTYALVCGGKEAGFATLNVATGLVLDGIPLHDGLVGTPYTATVGVSGGAQPYTWTVAGLPKGLTATINGTTITIQGTPQQFGVANVSITVSDNATPANQVSITVPLNIVSSLKIIQTSLVKGTVGAKYSKAISFNGGIKPFTWSVLSGTLPNGLTLDPASGKIQGVPTDTGNSTVTIQVQDSEDTPANDQKTYTIKIVPTVQIAAVEFTQAIQQYETLDDLNTSLTNNNEPPVPIVTGKPGVMRVYFTKLKDATDVVLKVTGAINGQKAMNLPPDCDPSDARIHLNYCPSMDFYFTPPGGGWSTSLSLEDDTGTELETETFGITSRDTRAINLKGVWVCSVPGQPSSCQDPSVLLGLTGVMSAILPTSSVPPPTILPLMVDSDVSEWGTDLDGWAINTASIVNILYEPADASADQSSNQRTDYVGVYSSSVNSTGVGEIGGHGLVIPDSTTRLGVPNTPWTLAHEVGHTLNLLHTNLSNPHASAPPGCWNKAEDSSTYWPYSDNRVQSSTGDEYGFDVANGSVVIPNLGVNGSQNNAFELMAYCVSRWISPLNYKRALLFVNGGAVTAPSFRGGKAMAQEPGLKSVKPRATPPSAQGSFWNISGAIKSTGLVLDPIFTETMLGTSDPGTGTYAIEELGSSGQVLFTRQFTPTQGGTETLGTDEVSDPHFSEFVPATPGTASLVVLDPTGNTLATVTITGAPPTVAFTSPTAGFVGSGQQAVTWTATSTTATKFTSRIFYSTDSGTTWQPIEDSASLNTILDFDTLPGASSALLRVDVTDGVNTGSATSVPFSVAKKLPKVIVINTPIDGSVRAAADPIYLSGAAFDADDGVLTGKALQWSSDIQGNLGAGTPLSVNLQPGKHTITLTATDSDGNVLTATTHITLGGAAPVVTLTANNASGCTTATINATPGNMGADLTAVTYSFDGGATYTPIPLTSLPFNVPVNGSGTVNVVALAVDASGQVSSKSTNVTAGASCSATTLKANAGSGQSNLVGSAFPTALTTLVVDGTGNPVAGVTVNYAAPTSGASATLSAASATTNASGLATVTATANSVAGSYNVTATTANSTSTATFALTNSDFQIAAASSTLSVSKGSNNTDVITLSALGGFNGTVNFACSGLPSGTTCAFSPAQLTPTTATATTTMTIAASQTAAVQWPVGGMSVLACAAFVFLPRRRKHFLGLLLFGVIGILPLTGCGGGASPTQKGATATITVTASSGTLQRLTTVTLQIK